MAIGDIPRTEKRAITVRARSVKEAEIIEDATDALLVLLGLARQIGMSWTDLAAKSECKRTTLWRTVTALRRGKAPPSFEARQLFSMARAVGASLTILLPDDGTYVSAAGGE